MMLCVALCCSVLPCVAVCCSVLQCVAWCRRVLQRVAVCCSVLQCVAVCCSVLQCVAVCCSVLQCLAACCSVLQYVPVCWARLVCAGLFPQTSPTMCGRFAERELHTEALYKSSTHYGVASISRLLTIIGLFCRISSLL